MTCKINADTSDGLKIVSDTSGEIEIQDNGATRLTVGDTSTFATDLTVTTAGSGVTDILKLTTTASNTVPSILFNSDIGGTQHDVGRIRAFQGSSSAGGIIFETEDSGSIAERVRIQATGNVLLGKTSESYGTDGWCIKQNGRMHSSVSVSDDNIALDKDGTGNFIYFSTGTTQRGQISYDGSNVLYGTSSDYRLKENVDYSFDATTRLKQLKPCRFNWIADDTNTLQDGFIAHEVASVVANAVYGTKDATKQQDVYDSDGEKTGTETIPDYQSIDHSKLVPLLVKTIQELEARITALES
tara:strand:- start:263 stop:1162 length:900 start_codon:yes stop_codon:yes gene_type:complete